MPEHRQSEQQPGIRLLEVLQQLESLLVQAGDKHWSEVLRYHIRYVQHCPPRDITAAARNILDMYGGMGSFNDLALTGSSPFGELHTELWQLATDIVRASREGLSVL